MKVAGPWGARDTAPLAKTDTPRRYACEQCGAILAFEPGRGALACPYCGHRNEIAEPAVTVRENPLGPALGALSDEPPPAGRIATKCLGCGADFELAAAMHAGPCPFCGAACVLDPAPYRRAVPDGLLPFLIGEGEAKRLVSQWLAGLWLAPSGIDRQARGPGRLRGVYVPHWTFDAATETDYVGRRGDVYYVTQYVDTVVNGRRERRAVQVPKVRWTPVAGRVARDFDDVLVTAGDSLPRTLVEPLEPWGLDGVRGYSPDFLSGFEAELYQLPADEGYARAQATMRAVITGDVRADIGGDQQSIGQMEARFGDPSYKLILLPVWVAAFRFLDRSFSFVVNGRTGEVHGQRPWSAWKMAAAVVLALVLLAIAAGLYYATGADLRVTSAAPRPS